MNSDIRIRKTAPGGEFLPGRYWLALAIIAALAVGYLFWLDAGCGAPLHTGIMTWHGKECLQ